MATNKLYTEDNIKGIILTRINKIQKLNSNFTSVDSTYAFNSAIRECGYDLPVTGDDYIDQKNEWIMKRMIFWFYHQVRERNLLLIESGDMKAGGIVDRLSKILNDMNVEFDKAKTADVTAHLFVNSTMMFGDDPLVIDSGFVQDSVGQDISDYTTGLI